MRISKKWGQLLASIWLIIIGLSSIVSFGFAGLGVILAILAIIAGALLILGR